MEGNPEKETTSIFIFAFHRNGKHLADSLYFINALFFDTIDGFLGQQHCQHRLKDFDNSSTFHQLSILLKHLRTAYKQV